MKIIFIGLFAVILNINLSAQEPHIDTVAIMILNKMGTLIGELQSCSFTLKTSSDEIDVDLGLVKYFKINQVYLVGPDKMLINSRGNKGHLGYWYNGKQLMYYSYTENNYGVIDAPPTIIATIDTVHARYGIDFPAADFFYPTFTEDLIADFDQIIFAGQSQVDGNNCYQIIAKNDQMSIQIWISDDALFLPMKFVIVYYDINPNQQFEGTFSDWRLNPELPNEIFEFSPPPNASQLILLPKY